MSALTYASSSYVVKDDVIRIQEAIHGPLLEQLISNAKSSFYQEDTKYDHHFTSIHDKIQNFFIKKATNLMDSFFASPAGISK